MLFASSPPFLMDSLLFQLFHFLCFCSDWWVQAWYFSCHSTLISNLHGSHWKRFLKGSKLSDILKSHLLFPVLAKPKGSLPSTGLPPPQPLLKFAATSLSSLPVNLLCHWKVFQKSPGDSCSPLFFPNYCLRKPETFIPVPRGDLFITKTSFSLTKPSWNHSASPHSHTNFPHCQRGYSPLSGIHPLLCQGKKPICPVTLKGRVIYRETHCIRKSFCNIICNLLERPRHSYTEQGTHLFTSVKGTVFRTSGYATLLVITQGHQSKITILLFFFSR